MQTISSKWLLLPLVLVLIVAGFAAKESGLLGTGGPAQVGSPGYWTPTAIRLINANGHDRDLNDGDTVNLFQDGTNFDLQAILAPDNLRPAKTVAYANLTLTAVVNGQTVFSSPVRDYTNPYSLNADGAFQYDWRNYVPADYTLKVDLISAGFSGLGASSILGTKTIHFRVINGGGTTPTTQGVVELYLAGSRDNANYRNVDIMPLGDFDLNQTGDELNIRAKTNPSTVGSVRFFVRGMNEAHVERVREYLACGDDSNSYRACGDPNNSFGRTWTPVPGTYTIEVAACAGLYDDNGVCSNPIGPTVTRTFTVTDGGPGPTNQRPIADAGPDQTITLPIGQTVTSATLDGSGSRDPDGGSLHYDWSGTPSPADVVRPVVGSLTAGIHIFSLRVQDPVGDWSNNTDTVEIRVQAPTTGPVCGDGRVDTSIGETCDFSPNGQPIFSAGTPVCPVDRPVGTPICNPEGSTNECRINTGTPYCQTEGPGPTGDVMYVDSLLTQDCLGRYSPATRSCGSGSDDAYDMLKDATAVAVAGETIYMRGGTHFAQEVGFANGGAPGRPITIEGYRNEEVILTQNFSGGSSSKPIFSVFSRAGYTPVNGQMLGRGYYTFRNLTGDGRGTSASSSGIIYMWYFETPSVADRVHHIVIDNVKSSGFAIGLKTEGYGVDNITIKNSEFSHMTADQGGIAFGNNQWNYDMPQGGSGNILIENTDFHDNNISQQANGLVTQPSTYNVTIINSRAWNNAKYGFALKGSGGFFIDRASSWGNKGAAFYLRGMNEDDPGPRNVNYTSDFVIINSIGVSPKRDDNNRPGVLTWRDLANIKAYNNVFYSFTNQSTNQGNDPLTTTTDFNALPITMDARNNLFVSDSYQVVDFGMYQNRTYRANNNLFYQLDGTPADFKIINPAQNNTRRVNFAGWKEFWTTAYGGNTNADTQSIEANPRFVNVVPHSGPNYLQWSSRLEDHVDFHLLANSPAIGAGENLSRLFGEIPALRYDRDGRLRPTTGPWTIGPYEPSGDQPPLPGAPLVDAGADQSFTLGAGQDSVLTTLRGIVTHPQGLNFSSLWSGASLIGSPSSLVTLVTLGQGIHDLILRACLIVNPSICGQDTTRVTVLPPTSSCGNGAINAPQEQCDGALLGGQTCSSLGYTGGTLSCYAAGAANPCTYNVTQCTSNSGGGVVSGELRQWHKVTVTFTGPNTSEAASTNPFTNYRLDVTFTHPASGTSYVVPGYYAADGDAANSSAVEGNKWRVHFTPDRTGEWRYTASFKTGANAAINNTGSATGFNGATGTFVVVTSNKTAPDFRAKGMLNYVGKHYLQFAGDGTYFLKGGADSPENFLAYAGFDGTIDTNGTFLHQYGEDVAGSGHDEVDYRSSDQAQTWKNGKGKGILGAINYLSAHGGNSIYFMPYTIEGGDGRDTWPWTSENERLRFDVSKLDQWEKVFEQMDKKGIQLHAVLAEDPNDMRLGGSGDLNDIRKLYYRELVARFGHHLAVIWNIAEESDQSDAQLRNIAQYIRATDPYDHPITVHTLADEALTRYDGLYGNTNFEATSIQGTGARYNEWAREIRRLSSAQGRKWAVYGDEQGPAVAENLSNLHDLRRGTLWGNLMGGGAGVEWYFGYQTRFHDIETEDWSIAEPLWDQTSYALRFFQNNLPFTEMNECNSSLTVSGSYNYCFGKAGDTYAVYLSTPVTARLTLPTGTYSLRWYNPVTGTFFSGTSNLTSTGGQVSLGASPSSADAVALLKQTGSSGGSATLMGAGDIAGRSNNNEAAISTTVILNRLMADNPSAKIFAAGDTAYTQGTDEEYRLWYTPTWGQPALKAATMFPVPGNHEYVTPNAAGFYNYFGAAARGPNGEPYYVKELGGWRIYGLNSEISHNASSEQLAWLRADLAAHPTRCIMAIWHKPRFSSGFHGNDVSQQPFWDALYAANADVVVNGHDHSYERFARQSPSGVRQDDRGIRGFVVGTGGYSSRPMEAAKPNSEVREGDLFGVMEFTLRPDGYDWQFHPAAGDTFTDQGTESCVI